MVSAVLSARSLLVCRVLTPLLCRVLTPLLCVPLRLPLRLLGCSMRRLSVGPRISRVIACTVAVVVVGAWVLSPCASILLVRRVPRGLSWVSVVLSLRMLAPTPPRSSSTCSRCLGTRRSRRRWYRRAALRGVPGGLLQRVVGPVDFTRFGIFRRLPHAVP